MSDVSIIIVGAGGHARVLIDTLLASGVQILGIVDANTEQVGGKIRGIPVLGGDEVLHGFTPGNILLVNGIGSSRSTDLRKVVYERFTAEGYEFMNAIHPSAVISPSAVLMSGVQIMAGVVIQPDALIKQNVLVNTGVTIDHECRIEAHAHLAPGVTLSGSVSVGEGAHIGTGSVVIQGVRIGCGAFVAAGAVVVGDVPDGQKVMGVPAREVAS